MSRSLQGLTVDELDRLIAEAQVVREETREKRRKALRAEFEQRLRSEGFTAHEVLGARLKAQPDSLPPRYADPADPSRTWSGKGRMPGWLQELADAGSPLENFLINKKARSS